MTQSRSTVLSGKEIQGDGGRETEIEYISFGGGCAFPFSFKLSAFLLSFTPPFTELD